MSNMSDAVLNSKHNPSKSFVIPTFGVELSKDLTVRMNPLALAIAIELEQVEAIAQERRSAFVELAFEGYLFRESLRRTIAEIKAGRMSLS